jgi:hypothetical protein
MIEVVHTKRRRPGREVPDPSQELYQESKPSDYFILPDTNIYLYNLDCVKALNEEHPGKVLLPIDIQNELEGIKKGPKKNREKRGIIINDYCRFMADVYKNTSSLGCEPFCFPTFMELLSSDDEKKREAAEKIKAAANCSYGGNFSNGRTSWVDMSLFIGPVYGNGDFDYQWIVLSRDTKVISTGENLKNDGYKVVTVGDKEALDYHAGQFL